MLREYQDQAVLAMLGDLRRPGNSIVCLPTAAGKSHIIAEFAHRSGGKVLILCPNREILKQDREKLSHYTPDNTIGIYSASLNSRTIKMFTFATVGSVYKRASLFSAFDCVVVDEAHEVPTESPNSMYMKFFGLNDFPKTFGLTASPYRNIKSSEFLGVADGKRQVETTSTLKLITRLDDSFWDRIIYNINPQVLRDLRFTLPTVYRQHHLLPPDRLKLLRDGSDYDQGFFARAVAGRERALANTIIKAEARFASILVFCANIAQANSLSGLVPGSGVVHSKIGTKDRLNIVTGFRDGLIKTVFNVQCLTLGFDSPRLDCLVILRPTRSLSLWQQFIGRGVRISPKTNKTQCTVLDFSGTYSRMGAAEDIQIKRDESGRWNVWSGDQFWHDERVSSYIVKY